MSSAAGGTTAEAIRSGPAPAVLLALAMAVTVVAVTVVAVAAAGPSSAAPGRPAAAGGVYIPAPGARRPARGNRRFEAPLVATSSNWAGYLQVGSTGTYTAVEDSWIVPTLRSRTRGYSSDWVGIGGASDDTLVQAGTEADSFGKDQVLYQAWTEVLPQDEDPLAMTVSPGDPITVLVQEVAPDQWLMQVSDARTGVTRQRVVGYQSSGASAEAIHERPCVQEPCTEAGDLAGLAHTTHVIFDPGSFSTSSPGANTPSEPLLSPAGGATVYKSVMKGRRVLATPSAPNAGNTGFAVADGRKAPPAPGS